MVNSIIQGDCIEVVKSLKSKSIDMVVADPPYNIKKAKWDNIQNYIEWLGARVKECERVLKDSGSFYLFHSDFSQIIDIALWIRENTSLVFNSFIVLRKKHFRSFIWKYPTEKSILRSWFNVCEYLLFFTFQDRTGWSKIYSDRNCFLPIKKYFRREREKIKKHMGFKTTREFNSYINEITNTRGIASRHYFDDSQWCFPTKEMYAKLQKTGFFQRPYETSKTEYEGLKLEYESLKQEYEKLRYTHNLDNHHCNVWEFTGNFSHKYKHPTVKDLKAITRIINCSSNPGDLVLDPFMGSGTTIEACINTGRQYIGIEKEQKYIDIAEKRRVAAMQRNQAANRGIPGA